MKKKNKVAIYYDTRFGRNDGSPLYYFNQLRQRKDVEVFHLLPQGDISQFGPMDFHFWVDWGEDGLPWEEWYPPKDGGKTVYIASDTHLGQKYRFNKAKKFDYVFFNQKRATLEWNKWAKTVAVRSPSVWLPHAVEPQAYPHFEILKRWDVCFIGHMQEAKNYNGLTRIDALDKLFREFPNFYYGSRHPAFPGKNLFEDAAKKFSQSKIVFNISIGDDINMRTFESMATGSMLLTNWLPTLENLFEDGKHLVTYKTMDEAIKKATYYLTHDKERERIARAGMKEVLSKHTYKKRLDTIFKTIS